MLKKLLVLPVVFGLLSSPAVAEVTLQALQAYASKDYQTSEKLLTPQAQKGDAQAQYFLGNMHLNGWGVDQDYQTASTLYRSSAEQGYAAAQGALGLAYIDGIGVIQDHPRAHMWLNIAASQGNKVAVEYRNKLAKQMTPEQLIEAQKLARECVAKDYKGC